jgi:hypothetical protein
MAGVDPVKCRRFWIACQHGDQGTVDGMIAAHAAATVNAQVLQLDLNHASEAWGAAPLAVAASLGHLGIVRALLRAGCYPLDEADVQPCGARARRAARLERSGYSSSPVNQHRRHCKYLLTSIRKAPCILSTAVASLDGGQSIIARVKHPQIDLLLGGCEFQTRQTHVGAPILVPRVLYFISAEEKGVRNTRLGGPMLERPGRRFHFRCRLHSTPLKPHYRSFTTEWSPWSQTAVLIPQPCLAAALQTAEHKAGTSYRFANKLDELTRCGISSASGLYKAAATPDLERQLMEIGTEMEFHERRKLIWSLRSGDQELAHYEFDERERRAKGGSGFEGGQKRATAGTKTDDPPPRPKMQQQQQSQRISTAMSSPGSAVTILGFLQEHSLPEVYAPWLLRIVDNLPQLLEAYKDRREFMDDIRESLPSMKGGHRLMLWKAMRTARRANASTSTADLDE